MLASLGATLAPIFGAAAGSSGAGAASQPDTVTIDTGDITPTVGGAPLTVVGGSGPWLWVITGVAIVLLFKVR